MFFTVSGILQDSQVHESSADNKYEWSKMTTTNSDSVDEFAVLLDKQLHRYTDRQTHNNQEPGTEWVQALADISRSCYVARSTQPVHRLQIRPIVHD